MNPTLVTPGGGHAAAAKGTPPRGRVADAGATGGGFADVLGAATTEVGTADSSVGEAHAASGRRDDVEENSGDMAATDSAASAPVPAAGNEVRGPWSLPSGWNGWPADEPTSVMPESTQGQGDADSTTLPDGDDRASAGGSLVDPSFDDPGAGGEAPTPSPFGQATGTGGNLTAAVGASHGSAADTPVPDSSGGGNQVEHPTRAATAPAPAVGTADVVAQAAGPAPSPEEAADALPQALPEADPAVPSLVQRGTPAAPAVAEPSRSLTDTEVEVAEAGDVEQGVAVAAGDAPASAPATNQTRTGDEVVSVTVDRSGALETPISAAAVAGWQRATSFDGGVSSPTEPVPLPAEAAAVVDQVVKSLRMQWRQGVGEARIQLRPEHLGPLDIAIRVDGGAITAVVRAESSQVQEWILDHQHSLRQQLEAAGLRLDALVVSPDSERRQRGEPGDTPRQTPRRRRDAGEHAPIFEVIV